MARSRFWVAAACALLATAVSASAVAQDAASSDKALTEKGLKKSAPTFYVVEGEAEFAKALAGMKSLQKALTDAEKELAGQRQLVEQMEDAEVEMTKSSAVLNAQLASATSVNENNRIVGMLNSLTDRRKLIFEQIEKTNQTIDQLRAKASAARERYLQALLDSRNLLTKIDADYAALAEDADVNAALQAVSTGDKKYTLGPSARHTRSIKDFEKFEGTVVSEKIVLRAENGVHWVDVVINGKKTAPMVLDSGASLLTIPYELAEELGIRPTDADQTVRLKIASGQIVEGKLKTLESVKVGGFLVENVEAVVMPSHLVEVDPLLGGSYLNNFTYKIDPATKELRMTSVAGAAKPEKKPTRSRNGSKPTTESESK